MLVTSSSIRIQDTKTRSRMNSRLRNNKNASKKLFHLIAPSWFLVHVPPKSIFALFHIIYCLYFHWSNLNIHLYEPKHCCMHWLYGCKQDACLLSPGTETIISYKHVFTLNNFIPASTQTLFLSIWNQFIT